MSSPTSRLLSSSAAIYLRRAAGDRLLLTLLALLLVLAPISRVGLGGLLAHSEPGLIIALTALMAASSSLLASGYPSLALSLLLTRGLPTWLTVYLVSAATGLLAAVLTNDASLFVSVPTAMLLAGPDALGVDAAFIAAMVTLGANIGSALTPMGNPQNLIIVDTYHVGFLTFIEKMAPLVATGNLIVLISSLALSRGQRRPRTLPPPATRLRPLLTGSLALMIVIHGVDTGRLALAGLLGLAIVAVGDREALKGVSLYLLAVIELFLLDFWFLSLHLQPVVDTAGATPLRTYTYALLLSQAISNVPATVLLAGHTPYWHPLAYGVNIGGTILIWGSLANIITLRLAPSTDTRKFQAYLLIPGLTISIIFFIIYI